MTKFSLLLLAILLSFASCRNATPIPRDKESFIGLWISHSGFQIEIQSSGIAIVIPISNTKTPDYYKLDVGVTPEYAKKMFVGFEGDSALSLLKPQLRYKAFRIDRNPYLDGDTTRMVLNGVILIKQK
jgi:hypothetical protein